MGIDVILLTAFLTVVVLFLFRMFEGEPVPPVSPGSVVPDLCPDDEDYVSDEEFLAACQPGVRPAVALKVRSIIAEQLCIPEHEVHPSHRLVEDLGAD